jgi:hypothetical protein
MDGEAPEEIGVSLILPISSGASPLDRTINFLISDDISSRSE